MSHPLIRLLMSALPLLFAPWASAVDGVTPQQLVIGQTVSMQAGRNAYGSAVVAGAQAYLQAVNRQGGVHGRQLVLKTLDDNGDPALAEANARHLLERDKVFVLFGSIEGGPTAAVMKVAAQAQVPFFGPMAGSPTLRRPHQPLVFPVRAEHREEFRALLDYARKTGTTRVGFLRADTETGRLHLENLSALCRDMGMELVADLPYGGELSDAQLAEMARRLAATQTQLVLNHGNASQYERLIRTARAQGLRTTFSGVNSGSTELARRLGELAHGMVFSQVVPSPWERKAAITREYQAEFSRLYPGQDFSYGSLEGYLTAKALVSALKQAGPRPTRESFVQGLYELGTLDLNGLRASYQPGVHAGLPGVALSIVSRDGRFVH